LDPALNGGDDDALPQQRPAAAPAGSRSRKTPCAEAGERITKTAAH
jgi:hypothetical protein